MIVILEFPVALHLFGYHAAQLSVLDAGDGLLAQAVLGRHRVERIVNLQPMHGKVVVCPEVAVGKHLGCEIAELDVEAQFPAQLTGDSLEHQWENLLTVYALVVLTLTVHAPLGEEVGRDERAPASEDSQQVGYNLAVLHRHHHIGRLPRSLLHNAEQLGAVEKPGRRHFRHFLAPCDDLNAEVFFHSANLQNSFCNSKFRGVCVGKNLLNKHDDFLKK